MCDDAERLFEIIDLAPLNIYFLPEISKALGEYVKF
jgi:hypothetical protein